MREYPQDFIPFLAGGREEGGEEGGLEAYAHRLEETAEWGGELEIRALVREREGGREEGGDGPGRWPTQPPTSSLPPTLTYPFYGFVYLQCHAYQRPIRVFAAEQPVYTMGESDYPEEAALLLSYHRQFYALGEHYNSVVPVKGGRAEEES